MSWFYLYSQKLLKIRTSGGGDGFENSDTPGQGEEGGLKTYDFGGRPK